VPCADPALSTCCGAVAWWGFGASEHCGDRIHTEFARDTNILSKIPSREQELGLRSEILQISVSMMGEGRYCKDQQISCLEDFWAVDVSHVFLLFILSEYVPGT